MNYQQRQEQVQRRLGNRGLVYFGTRGTDASPLLEFDHFQAVFSQIAPLQALNIGEVCLEAVKAERVDLNRYSIDEDLHSAVRQLHAGLMRAFARPCAVLPYRPSSVLTSAWFPRADRVLYLGMFHEKQACFEHKPWVETQLDAAGIRILPWQYYSDEDVALIQEAAMSGPLVLRANRSDGGAGLDLVRDPSELMSNWPSHHDGFLAAAPYLEGNVPVNANACVFSTGEVSIHPPSLQLIGIPECTNRPFGYCGNDFARIKESDPKVLRDFDQMIRVVGRWLASQGYRGAFGVDALLYKGGLYLVEVNPRFQGSSALASDLMREIDLPDLHLDHIASLLGLPPTPTLALPELVEAQPPAAHLICYNKKAKPVYTSGTSLDLLEVRGSLTPEQDIAIQEEAILFDLSFSEAITSDGADISRHAAEQIRQAKNLLRT